MSLEAKKALGKIKHHFMLKILRNISIEAILYSVINSICEKYNTRIFQNWERLETFALI